jgi:hypothetical protein
VINDLGIPFRQKGGMLWLEDRFDQSNPCSSLHKHFCYQLIIQFFFSSELRLIREWANFQVTYSYCLKWATERYNNAHKRTVHGPYLFPTRVRGQLTCLEVKPMNKKKSCRLYVNLYLQVVSRIHDVYLYESVKTLQQLLGRGLSLWYDLLEQRHRGENKQTKGPNLEEGVSLPPGQDWDGPIGEVRQKIAAQVCMNVIH